MDRDPGGRTVRRDRQWAFTGLDSGAIELISAIPNTGKVAVYRIEPDNYYELIGLTDDPAIAMQAALN